jgi:hypothetical protein
MTRKNNNKIISVVHPICCGLDAHRKMFLPVSLSPSRMAKNHLLISVKRILCQKAGKKE